MLWRFCLLNVGLAWIAIAIMAYALYVVLEPVNTRLAQLALFLRLGASFGGTSSVMLCMTVARLYQASATEGLFTSEQLHTLVTVNVRSFSAGVEMPGSSWA